jgi:single-strand DNA-binding protein
MGFGLNKMMVIGHLGQDPEMRFTPNGKSVAYFSIAHKYTWKSIDGESQTHTEWFNVISWGNLAEDVKQSLEKGDLAYVEGRLQSRSWEDEKGCKQISVEIIANEIINLSANQTF